LSEHSGLKNHNDHDDDWQRNQSTYPNHANHITFKVSLCPKRY